jgi:WD40 repeat protein
MKTYIATILYCIALISFIFSTTFAQKPELVAQTGHSDFIELVVFSHDGKLIASGSRDGINKLWDSLFDFTDRIGRKRPLLIDRVASANSRSN